jgi:hypothetical protein
VGVVIVGNLPYLLHLFDPNPLDTLSGLGTVKAPGLIAGNFATDPNVGLTAQALGHLSMVDWIHGHIPWWNPYEGLGSPLAGEMQAATFFPPTAFLLLSNGQVLSHITVELVAGLSTYFLLRRLALRRPASVAGGIAFALNGTFSWLSHAPTNPVAFLPLLLLGVELAADAHRRSPLRAWSTIGVALALSFYAGFPETAYIDGIFVGLWVVIRAVQLRGAWHTFLLTIAKGIGLGLLLVAPLLIAFVDYLPQAYVGAHNGAFATFSLPRGAFSQAFLPYVYGPINAYSANDATGTLTAIWGSVGGYVTFSVFLLALIGLYGSRLRALRFALLAWTILSFGRTYGVQPFQHVVNALPVMRDVAFFRYSSASSALALIVLAAFGLDDLARGRVPRRWVLTSCLLSMIFLALIASGSRSEVDRLVSAANHDAWAGASVGWAIAIIGLTVVACLFLRGRVRTLVLVAMVALDAVAMFAVPELSAPRSVKLDTAPISFLQRHLGTYRFYSIGTIQPNYGSYFGLSSLDANDLPVPKLWATFLTHQLDPNASPPVFNGSNRTVATGPTALAEFAQRLGAFEMVGVKYLVLPAGTALPTLPPTKALDIVFSDRTVQIYQLPSPRPMYSTLSGTCTIKLESTEHATVTCPSPQTLVRSELYMKGWSASLNGRAIDVSPYDDVLQQVRVPAGTSVITFTFTPPHVVLGYAAFLLGLACLIVLPFRRRARHRATHGNYRVQTEHPEVQGPITPDDRQRVPVPDGRSARSTPDRSLMPSGGD